MQNQKTPHSKISISFFLALTVILTVSLQPIQTIGLQMPVDPRTGGAVLSAQTVSYQQGVGGYDKAVSLQFNSRSQNPAPDKHYYRMTGSSRYYNLEYFNLGNTDLWGTVTSAKLTFYQVGGYVYNLPGVKVYVRRINDPDNLGGSYPTGWKIASSSGFRVGANAESRDDTTIPDTKWRTSDPGSPDDLGADYFQHVLKPIEQSPYFVPSQSNPVGYAYELDVTDDVECIRSGACVNQGWATYHEDAANIQYVIGSSLYADPGLRPKLEVTYTALEADTINPSVSITSPSHNSSVSGTITITASANDNHKLSRVQFSVNGSSLGTEDTVPPYSAEWDTSNLSAGNYTLTATAYDATGNQASSSVTVTVNDANPPVLSNKSPSGGLNSSASSATLSLATNEPATCRYATTANTAYSSMTTTFSTTGGTSHQTQISGLSNGADYSYYVRCQDTSGNATTSDYLIYFWIESAGGSFNIQPYTKNDLSNLPMYPLSTAPEPAVNECVYDSQYGSSVCKIVDANQMPADHGGTIRPTYSRWRIDNSDGSKYYLAKAGETPPKTGKGQAVIFNSSDNSIYRVVKEFNSHENSDLRWDYTGNRPNIMYYHYSCKFYEYDVTTGQSTVIRDFKQDFPTCSDITMKGEGDSSSNSRYWVFMVQGPYDGANYPLLAIITYDKQDNKILGTLDNTRYKSLGGKLSSLPKPDAVDMSPLGTKAVLLFLRNNALDISDGPHAFDLQFNAGMKVCNDATHSGWAFDYNGDEVFVCQINNTNWPQAIADTTSYTNINTGETHAIYFDVDSNWQCGGRHYGKFYNTDIKGWVYLSTYCVLTNNSWTRNQAIMFEIKPYDQNPRIWRIADLHNNFPQGSKSQAYSREAFSPISGDGKTIYWGGDWPGGDGTVDTYKVTLPDRWWITLASTQPVATTDTQKPTIPTSLQATAASGTQINLSWSPATDNIGVVNYRVYRNGGAAALATTANTSYTDTNLTPGVSYSYAVEAVDAAGNTSSKSLSVSASTLTQPDINPPTVTITIPQDNQTLSGTTSITATALDNTGVSSVQFLLNDQSLGNQVVAAPYTLNWNTSLYPNGSYRLSAKALDAAGNTATSTAILLNISNGSSETKDTTPPNTITDLTSGNLAQTSVDLSFTSQGDNNGATLAAVYELRYSTSALTTNNFASGQLANGAPAPKAAGQKQTYTLVGLSSGTTYYAAIVAKDAAGNTSPLSNIISFTTLSVPTNQQGQQPTTAPPQQINSLRAISGGSKSIQLSWTNPPDPNFVRTLVIKKTGPNAPASITDGERVYEGVDTSFTDTSVLPEQQYSYAVFTYNRSLRYSAPVTILVTASSANEPSGIKLVNHKGTYYLIQKNERKGIPHQGILFSHGLDFSNAVEASEQDLGIPESGLLLPADGSLVKSREDATVYLISGQKRLAFTSDTVFRGLGFSFPQIKTVTNPELQALAIGRLLNSTEERHPDGVEIQIGKTIYWINGGKKFPYTSLEIYNSWHSDNYFGDIVPANAADLLMQDGEPVTKREILK